MPTLRLISRMASEKKKLKLGMVLVLLLHYRILKYSSHVISLLECLSCEGHEEEEKRAYDDRKKVIISITHAFSQLQAVIQ